MEALKKDIGERTAWAPLRTRQEAAAAVKTHAHLTAQLGVLIATRDQATAELNKKLNDLLGKHQPAIDSTSQQITAIESLLEIWAKKNRKTFGKTRSLEFSHGFLRFRTGQRQLTLLARWTWEKTLQALKSYPVTSQWREYVRVKEEVNKSKLLMETKDGGKLPEVKLREIGLRVLQDESFEIEPKPDAVAKDCDLMP